jgi:phytoene dehydrogenase-like protein
MSVDCVILGATHNGLAAAATLAAGGRSVLVLEAREVAGGLAAGEEFHPGYRHSGVLHDSDTFLAELVEPLALTDRGLALRAAPRLLAPRQHAPGLILDAAGGTLERISPADARAWPEWRRFMEKVRPFVRQQMLESAPSVDRSAKLGPLARRALGLRRLGGREMLELLRVAPTSVDDWLSEWFETPLLRAALAAPGLLGTWMTPRSPGSTAGLLVRECLADREVAGGPAALTRALLSACEGWRVRVRTGAKVARIRLEGDTVRGVVLEDGEAISARVVLSALDARRTFLELIDPLQLPEKLEDIARNVRCRGITAKVHLALSAPLEFPDYPGQRFERVRIAEHPDDLERAHDAVKYRRMADSPLPLDVRVPSVSDPSLAPAGHHVVSILARGAPHNLEGGWTEEARGALGAKVLDSLSRYVPDLRDRLEGMEVLTPVDIEARYGLSGGHLYQAEHALDQLWIARPAFGLSRHVTPIKGLLLCGAATHPGGGITCGPGVLSARAALE